MRTLRQKIDELDVRLESLEYSRKDLERIPMSFIHFFVRILFILVGCFTVYSACLVTSDSYGMMWSYLWVNLICVIVGGVFLFAGIGRFK